MGAVLKLSLLLSLALMLGRLSGLAREMVLAARFGVSSQADLAITLLTLPDILVGVLLAGGFTAALVPAFRLAGPGAQPLLRRALIWCGLGFSALALAIALFPGPVLFALNPAIPFMHIRAGVASLQWSTLALPFAALSGVLLAYLNARERFFAPGLGTLAFNLIVIAALLLLARGTLAFWPVVVGLVGGAAARLALMAALARRTRPATASAQPVPPGLARRFAFGIAATGLLVAAPVVFRSLAAGEGAGTLAAFAYALKLFELPTALVFAPLATVLLPRMVQVAHAPVDPAPLVQGLSVALLAAFVAIVLGATFGADLVAVIFGHGAMGVEGQAQITALGQILFLGLPGAGLALIAAAGLNAQGRAGRVLAGTVAAFALALGVTALGGPLLGFVTFYTVAGLAHVHALGLRPGPVRGPALVRLLALGVAAACVWGLSTLTPDWPALARATLCLPATALMFAPFVGQLLNLKRIVKAPRAPYPNGQEG